MVGNWGKIDENLLDAVICKEENLPGTLSR